MPLKQFDSTLTKIDLINIALSYINQPSISSLEERSEAAMLMKLHWPLSLRSLLYKANWSFALDREKLEHLQEEEDDNKDKSIYPYYTYCYSLPSGLIRIANVFSGGGKPLLANRGDVLQRLGSAPITISVFKLAGNKIWTKEEGIILEYVKNVTNVNVFPPAFMNCICYDLALRGAKILIDSASYVEQMRSALSQELMFAMNLDAGQQIGEFAY